MFKTTAAMFNKRAPEHWHSGYPVRYIPDGLGGRSTKDLLKIVMRRPPGRPKKIERRLTQQDIIDMAADQAHESGLTLDEVLYIYCRKW